jgi:hypothetical protein
MRGRDRPGVDGAVDGQRTGAIGDLDLPVHGQRAAAVADQQPAAGAHVGLVPGCAGSAMLTEEVVAAYTTAGVSTTAAHTDTTMVTI